MAVRLDQDGEDCAGQVRLAAVGDASFGAELRLDVRRAVGVRRAVWAGRLLPWVLQRAALRRAQPGDEGIDLRQRRLRDVCERHVLRRRAGRPAVGRAGLRVRPVCYHLLPGTQDLDGAVFGRQPDLAFLGRAAAIKRGPLGRPADGISGSAQQLGLGRSECALLVGHADADRDQVGSRLVPALKSAGVRIWPPKPDGLGAAAIAATRH